MNNLYLLTLNTCLKLLKATKETDPKIMKHTIDTVITLIEGLVEELTPNPSGHTIVSQDQFELDQEAESAKRELIG